MPQVCWLNHCSGEVYNATNMQLVVLLYKLHGWMCGKAGHSFVNGCLYFESGFHVLNVDVFDLFIML